MTFWSKIVGGGTPKETPAEGMKKALEARFPDYAASDGFVVEFAASRIKGEGVYTVRTLRNFSRSRWEEIGLTENKDGQHGQYTRRSLGMMVEFMFPQAALEKALGIAGQGAAPSV